jgi:hypothetical protein
MEANRTRRRWTYSELVGLLLEAAQRGLGEVFAGPVDVLFAS